MAEPAECETGTLRMPPIDPGLPKHYNSHTFCGMHNTSHKCVCVCVCVCGVLVCRPSMHDRACTAGAVRVSRRGSHHPLTIPPTLSDLKPLCHLRSNLLVSGLLSTLPLTRTGHSPDQN